MQKFRRSIVLLAVLASALAAGSGLKAQSRVLLAYAGAYQAGTVYNLNDMVSYQGGFYLSLVAENAGNAPATSAAQWVLLGPGSNTAVPGPAGPQGPAGSNGATGPAGPQGLIGLPGPSGPAGSQGQAGSTGATGPPGPAGAMGLVGPQGPAGTGGAGAAPSVFLRTANCSGGMALPKDWTIPSANAPYLGCANVDVSPFGYADFLAGAGVPQFLYYGEVLPANWTATDFAVTLYTGQAGSTGWSMQAACFAPGGPAVMGTPAYGPAVSATGTASGPGDLTTATLTGVATTGVAGCAPGAAVQYRLTRTDASAVTDAFVIGMTETLRSN